jgi:hypothetical protein
MGKARRLLDEYRFPGYQPKAGVRGVFGDSKVLAALEKNRIRQLRFFFTADEDAAIR